MDKQVALNQIAREFIDYSALSSSTLHYFNKTGMTMYFKYFLRIQSVMLDIIRTNPTRAAVLLGGTNYSGIDVATPFNANIIGADLGARTGLYDLLKGFMSHAALTPL